MARITGDGISGRSLMRSIGKLASYGEVEDVFAGLARILKRSLHGRWVLVCQLEREARRFVPVYSSGLAAKWEETLRRIPLFVDEPRLVHRLHLHRQLLLDDPVSSPLISPDYRRLLSSCCLLVLPLLVRRQVTGVVLVARSGKRGSFTREESAAVRELVLQTALVTSHLGLLDESLEIALEVAKRVDVILMLDDINKAISSSLNREQIIATALDRSEGVVQCTLQVLVELKGTDLVVLAGRSAGLPLPPQLAPGQVIEERGIIGQARASGESQYLHDMRKVPRESALGKTLVTAGIRSLMAVPIMTAEKTLGILLLGDLRPERFRSEEAFVIGKIVSQMAVAMENARLYEDTRQLFFNTVASLANAIDAKSSWTKGHSERVMRVAAAIARELGLSPEAVEQVRLGGLLHDIGKIGVMEALLEKPQELDEDEFPPMRLHPEKGVAILEPIAQLRHVLPGILHHHEFFDGSGYPSALVGSDIPLDARIIAVADSFDAMVADRPYRQGLSVRAAVRELVRCSGSQFDPEIVAAFRSHLANVTHDPSLMNDI